ncbi:hypothetical protein [Massilia sp. SYSU DXS3249]
MEKLIAQLLRLYLAPGLASPERLARHLLGQETLAVEPAGGTTRAIVLPFDRMSHGEDDAHWTALCRLASVLQVEYGFPAPAVSISGAEGYRLWLSLAEPVPVAEAQRFIEALVRVHAPACRANAAAPVPLPPCLHAAGGKWAAFINPGMGASFAEEPGLELPPPLAAQAAFLEDLESVGLAQFRQALQDLSTPAEPAPSLAEPVRPTALPAADGLLLRDATLEDIVRHLHARGIEPTFRHLLPSRS